MAEQTGVMRRWPKCKQAGCMGVRLTSAGMCLAHASEEETAAALKLVGETGIIDARGVPITPALLERILTAAPRGENEEPLIKGCCFDWAAFSGNAVFTGTTFSGDAEFFRATFERDARFDRATFERAVFGMAIFGGDAVFTGAGFSGDAEFDIATFEQDTRFDRATFERAVFAGATFKRAAGFDHATFKRAAGFDRATFEGDLSFAWTAFEGETAFDGAAFSGDAEFDRATFSGDVVFGGIFGGATFKRRATFRKTTFSGAAQFDGATFEGDTSFRQAAFESDAEFDHATFKRTTSFDGTTFKRRAGFAETTFSGNTEFHQVTFTGDAEFDYATFKRHARFDSVRFEQARQFGPLLACRGLVLDNVQFMQPVQIEVSSTGLCCRRARFPGGVQFRLRWARVVLDDTDLAEPSILAGIPSLFTNEQPFSTVDLVEREEQTARFWQRLLKGDISERPQLLSLRRANVAGLGLSNVSVANCRFEGSHNLDKLRLESNVSFTTAPLPLGLGGRRRGGREVIAEERAWRASRSRPRRWVAPWWPEWLDQRPSVLEPGQIAGLYRALRKGREDAKDEPGAADFYYGEMEMRRRARPLSASNPDNQSAVAARGQVERGILTAYWLVSGYGLRAWRAVACLAVVTAILAAAFHVVGFAVPPRPVSYWTSWLYASRATLSLTDNEVKLTAWGKLLQGVLRLTGPVLLGLALLALRGRVKR